MLLSFLLHGKSNALFLLYVKPYKRSHRIYFQNYPEAASNSEKYVLFVNRIFPHTINKIKYINNIAHLKSIRAAKIK